MLLHGINFFGLFQVVSERVRRDGLGCKKWRFIRNETTTFRDRSYHDFLRVKCSTVQDKLIIFYQDVAREFRARFLRNRERVSPSSRHSKTSESSSRAAIFTRSRSRTNSSRRVTPRCFATPSPIYLWVQLGGIRIVGSREECSRRGWVQAVVSTLRTRRKHRRRISVSTNELFTPDVRLRARISVHSGKEGQPASQPAERGRKSRSRCINATTRGNNTTARK